LVQHLIQFPRNIVMMRWSADHVFLAGGYQRFEDLLASLAAVEQQQLPSGDERGCLLLAGDHVCGCRQLLDDV
jgi:hypothetical protein